MTITFFVPGKPAPGGSKRAFAHKSTGRIIVTDDAKGNRDWKSRVADFASQHYQGEPLDEPLRVFMTFYQDRPRGHYGTGRNAQTLKSQAPAFPTSRPDALKLARSTEDACSSILWRDDCLTVDLMVRKRYGTPGVKITVQTMETPSR